MNLSLVKSRERTAERNDAWQGQEGAAEIWGRSVVGKQAVPEWCLGQESLLSAPCFGFQKFSENPVFLHDSRHTNVHSRRRNSGSLPI